ncbi:MAG: OmpA family protein [Qingshengfaniella sp.]
MIPRLVPKLQGLALLAVILPALTAAAAAQTSVPLLLPAEATPSLIQQDPPGGYSLATGPSTAPNQPPPQQPVTGPRTRSAYRLAGWGHRQIELLETLDHHLAQAGWTVLFTCVAPRCGGYDFRQSRDVLPLPDMFVDLGAFAYLAATDAQGQALEVITSPAGPDLYTQISQLRPTPALPHAEPRTHDLPAPSPAASPPQIWTEQTMDDVLRRDGRLRLAGLRFASGTAEVDVSQTPALPALIDWLRADPGRRIALVGHSDWSGSYATNQALSQRRAQSLADLLATDYAIDPARIEVHGAAYLVPLTGNTTPTGQEENRRVEAVALPPAP